MNKLEILSIEFPGTNAWKQFSDYYSDTDPNLCKQIAIDKDIAQVLIAKVGTVEDVNQWLKKPLPALDNECVSSIVKRSDGGRIIRSMVMRMP